MQVSGVYCCQKYWFRYWSFKNVKLWALLSRFVNTSDWPLCSRTQQICLWLATMINARERLKDHKMFESILKAGAFESRRLSVDRMPAFKRSRVYQCSVKCVKDVYLQHIFEALIILANHRHIWWAREHKGQSEAFRNPLNSTQSSHFLNFSTDLVPKFFDNTSGVHVVFVCVSQRKKIIQDWSDMRVSKWWQNFNFWLNHSFKDSNNVETASYDGIRRAMLVVAASM